METTNFYIYHTASASQVQGLASWLGELWAANTPGAKIELQPNGFVRYRNPLALNFPVNENTPKLESEARAAGDAWLALAQTWEQRAQALFPAESLQPEGQFPKFFHEGWEFHKAIPHYTPEKKLRYWEVMYRLRLSPTLATPTTTVPDHWLSLYVKYHNPQLLPAIDYCSLPLLQRTTLPAILPHSPEDQAQIRLLHTPETHTLCPYLPVKGVFTPLTEAGRERGEGKGKGAFQPHSKKGIFFTFTCDVSVKILNRSSDNFMEIPYVIGQGFRDIEFVDKKISIELSSPDIVHIFDTNEEYYKHQYKDSKVIFDDDWKKLNTFYLSELCKTIEYLSRSPFALSIIENCYDLGLYVPIYCTTDVTTASFNPKREDILYSPVSGCSYSYNNKTFKQTPALGLIHEIVHLINYFTNNDEFYKRLGKSDATYSNMEEKNVILNYENIVAEELGEPQRHTHKKVVFYKTKDSISIEEDKQD